MQAGVVEKEACDELTCRRPDLAAAASSAARFCFAARSAATSALRRQELMCPATRAADICMRRPRLAFRYEAIADMLCSVLHALCCLCARRPGSE